MPNVFTTKEESVGKVLKELLHYSVAEIIWPPHEISCRIPHFCKCHLKMLHCSSTTPNTHCTDWVRSFFLWEVALNWQKKRSEFHPKFVPSWRKREEGAKFWRSAIVSGLLTSECQIALSKIFWLPSVFDLIQIVKVWHLFVYKQKSIFIGWCDTCHSFLFVKDKFQKIRQLIMLLYLFCIFRNHQPLYSYL